MCTDHSPGYTIDQKTGLSKIKDWNNIKYIFWSRWHETRNKTQEKKLEKKNYMKTKQYATIKPMGQWGNQKGNLKILWDKQ